MNPLDLVYRVTLVGEEIDRVQEEWWTGLASRRGQTGLTTWRETGEAATTPLALLPGVMATRRSLEAEFEVRVLGEQLGVDAEHI